MKAPVNKIIPFSNVDGPGNRLSIFFQTCPFSCLFCHNPETIRACIHCGGCVATCPAGALTMQEGKVVWEMEKCVDCDTCIKVCSHLSSPKIRYMTVAEVMAEIEKVKAFIRGITVSGGECMNQAPFLLELFREVKKLGLTCLIDSNGAHDFSLYEELLDVSDGVMLDVKAYDESFHRTIIGASNTMVKKNLLYLLSKQKLAEVRTIIYPGQEKQNETTVKAVADIIRDACDYKLIRYRPYGVREEGLEFFGRASTSEEELIRCREIAKEHGAHRIVSV